MPTPHRTGLALLAATLLACLAQPTRAGMLSITSGSFNYTMGVPQTVSLQPFDKELGELERVLVRVDGQIIATMMGTKSGQELQLQILESIDGIANRGFGYGDKNMVYLLSGVATAPEAPTPIVGTLRNTFEFSPATETIGGGLVTRPSPNAIVFPPYLTGDRDSFTQQDDGLPIMEMMSLGVWGSPSAPVLSVQASGVMIVEYIYEPAWTDNQVDDGGFDNGLADWTVTGAASLANPYTESDNVIAEIVLDEEKPATLAQTVALTGKVCELGFDLAFPDGEGLIEITLDGKTLFTLDGNEAETTGFRHRKVRLDLSELGLAEEKGELAFRFTGKAEQRVWLDNIALYDIDATPVPEPASLLLLTTGSLLLRRRKR